jgi:hypothetical protein
MPQKTIYKFLKFEEGIVDTINCWKCMNKKSGAILACIQWYPKWKEHIWSQYIPDAIFNNTCLLDIADFLTQLNTERKGIK